SNIYMYLAGAHQHLLQYDDSNRWARTSIELGERQGSPFAVATGNEFLAENAAGRGHWDDALAYAARDAEEGRKIGSLRHVTWAEFSRVQGLHGKGELRAALQATQAALARCEQIGETRLATWLDPMAAIIAADLGDDESARMHAQRGWERAQQLNQLVLSAWALHAQGYSAIQRGDTGTALEWYEQYVALVRDTENGVARHLVMARGAEAYFLCARLDDAARLTERAIADASFANAPHYLALARRVQGQILGAQKRYDEAMCAFDEAIAAFIATGSRLELARAMYHRAALRSELGDRDAALADAARARDEFEAMEAVRDRAMAEALLSK
ncbi:MAG TPA: hypothetical protein VGT81_15605, partial [Casimicrobiaceae bacterium]|nr:hypothetical protein [Casimicrobiaceae bacterium]